MVISSPRVMSDPSELWNLYKPTEQRAGPLSMTSTPKAVRPRQPETPNVTNIGMEQDENFVAKSDREMLMEYIKMSENLKSENAHLREANRKLQASVKRLTDLIQQYNISSEMESSESHNERSSSISVSSSSKTKVQRVTPTKRETSSSSDNISTPPSRPILEPTSTPRSNRGVVASVAATVMQRSSQRRIVVPLDSDSSNTPIMTNPRRPRLPVPARTPQSLPVIRTRETNVSLRPGHTTFPPVSERRLPPRRRLFPESPSQNRSILQYIRTQSEPNIEHLNISPVKGNDWNASVPPREHLERNRPDFIERLEARQSILRAAANQRNQIEQRKRNAARAVATGQRSAESVSSDLFADSTKIRAFYQSDMREITMRNIRKTSDYRNQVWSRMANIDRTANRIIAQTHNIRTRSTSRPS